MMDPAIKKRWTDALRCGKYRQAHGALRDEDGAFCCLGVLCDLHAKAHNFEWSRDNTYFQEHLAVPGEVASWAGWKDHILNQHMLMRLNDTQRMPFSVIANYIEEKL